MTIAALIFIGLVVPFLSLLQDASEADAKRTRLSLERQYKREARQEERREREGICEHLQRAGQCNTCTGCARI
jgi:hypothetical protein